MKYGFYILLFFALSKPIFAQNSEKNLRITGESMQGKVINGENVREVIGNVVIIQDDVKITCNKAIQFLARNEAKLIGNVILIQDSVTIKTERGYYYRDIELTFADTNVLLDNGKSILLANKGKYNLNSKVAEFSGNVNFKDSTTDLESDSLVFYDIENKIIAIRNVLVRDSASMIYADTLIHNQNTHETFGYGNVRIFSEQNDLKIFGQKLFDDKNNKMSRIEGDPYLIQIDKTENGTADTLMIKAKTLEAYKDSTNRLIAKDSVQILRGEFSSVNDFTIYDEAKDNISIFRNELNTQPILWYENSQVTGDSIYIYMKENKIKNIDIIKNATIISEDSTFDFRYDQISGNRIILSFVSGKLKSTKVYENVLSIYYLYEDNEPNGLIKSSAKQIYIFLDSNRVADVKMIGNPISEYHPEIKVKGSEKNFTLPTFRLFENRPQKRVFQKILN